MRWLHAGNRRAKHADARHAVVVAVTTPLNRETALEVRRKVDLLDAYEEVVIDLTAIPAFDTDGADALFAIQGEQVNRRISIVGFRQATARLLGSDPTSPGEDVPAAEASHPGGAGWAVRRLRNLLVVQPEDVSAPSVTGLEETLGRATTDTNAAIIVVDLRGVQRLPPNVVEAVAFASSTAALRGQELLVVNVQAEAIETLRAAGLSATTFVAPEPFDAEPFGRERLDTGPFDQSPYGETPRRGTTANPGDARQR